MTSIDLDEDATPNWQELFGEWMRSRAWNAHWYGPAPDQHGTYVPQHILKARGITLAPGPKPNGHDASSTAPAEIGARQNGSAEHGRNQGAGEPNDFPELASAIRDRIAMWGRQMRKGQHAFPTLDLAARDLFGLLKTNARVWPDVHNVSRISIVTGLHELGQMGDLSYATIQSIIEYHSSKAADEDPSSGNTKEPVVPLETFSAAEFRGVDPPSRRWAVKDRIPMAAVTLFSGDGGIGKTTAALQLTVAVSASQSGWLNGIVEQHGPVLFFTAEEDKDEVHRRLGAIVKYHQIDYPENLHIYCVTELNPELAESQGKFGKLEITRLYEALRLRLEVLWPKLLVLEASAELFGGDEINKTQVRQFIAYLRKLARDYDCAVILLSHPSIRGMREGDGTSGNTAWHNSVRARIYLTKVEGNPSLRKLEIKKNNYGPAGETVTLVWRDGLYIPEPKPSSLERSRTEADEEAAFLRCLDELASQGRYVGEKPGTNYAPAAMAKMALGKTVGNQALAKAMERLFDKKEIRIGLHPNRRPSRANDVILRKEASNVEAA